MKTKKSMLLKKSVSIASIAMLLLTAPVLLSGTNYTSNSTSYTATTNNMVKATTINTVMAMADAVYDSMQLQYHGLSKIAFEYAWKGYQQLLSKGMLSKKAVLSICDFSQSSRKKRLYIINVEEEKLLVNTYVAHGRNSGGEFARSFSNSAESHKSSLGFYITGNTYFGDHGLALKIKGVEKGFNDKANARNIVVHGSEYVGPDFLRNNKFNGRSFGCPAVPDKEVKEVITTIQDGSCLFIYHPTKKYITKSRILNG